MPPSLCTEFTGHRPALPGRFIPNKTLLTVEVCLVLAPDVNFFLNSCKKGGYVVCVQVYKFKFDLQPVV